MPLAITFLYLKILGFLFLRKLAYHGGVKINVKSQTSENRREFFR